MHRLTERAPTPRPSGCAGRVPTQVVYVNARKSVDGWLNDAKPMTKRLSGRVKLTRASSRRRREIQPWLDEARRSRQPAARSRTNARCLRWQGDATDD